MNAVTAKSILSDDSEEILKPRIDPSEYGATLQRLRRMRATVQVKDDLKVARFWVHLRSKALQLAWLRCKQHWFGNARPFEEIVEKNIGERSKYSKASEGGFSGKFIDFEEDLASLRAEATFGGSQLEIVA